jgi:hypothetical protein
MKRKCFISFKTEDRDYKKEILENPEIDIVDKSLNVPIDSEDEDYIMRKIREDYLCDSTVTIYLIGQYSAESRGKEEQKYIKRELQASLYNGDGNKKSGILGVVLPSMYNTIYQGSGICSSCSNSHRYVNVDNSTTIREFNYNYYIPHNKCSWSEDDRYCVLVPWEEFKNDPNKYIEQAFEKRTAEISKKTRVYPE